MKRHPQKTKSARRYTFVAFRPPPSLEGKLKAFAAKTGLSVSRVVSICVEGHLAAIERNSNLTRCS